MLHLSIEVADDMYKHELVKVNAESNRMIVDSLVISLMDLASLGFMNANVSEEVMYKRIKNFCDTRNKSMN